jgi:hypothetical protein
MTQVGKRMSEHYSESYSERFGANWICAQNFASRQLSRRLSELLSEAVITDLSADLLFSRAETSNLPSKTNDAMAWILLFSLSSEKAPEKLLKQEEMIRKEELACRSCVTGRLTRILKEDDEARGCM